MNVAQLAAGLHPLERAVVHHLQDAGTLPALAKASGLKEVEAMRGLQWLENKGCVKIATAERDILVVREKGREAHENGMPEEYALLHLKREKKLHVSDIPPILPEYDKQALGPVVGALKKAGIPFVNDKDGKAMFCWTEGIEVQEPMEMRALHAAKKEGWRLPINKENRQSAQELLKRKGYATLARERLKSYTLTKLGKELQKAKGAASGSEERLTHAMLSKKTWAGKRFRPYDVTINVPKQTGGRLHPVTQAVAYIQRIWRDMGFEEMEGNHIQSAFWDLDALFVPQDHPAREMQDTFYLERSGRSSLPADVYKKVKAVHENGGDTGSLGWRTPFSKEESERQLLRTHTTVLSAQTLDAIRQQKKGMPGKYYAISTVYRNEALDWKHLFEFHQVEGIVVAEGMTLGHLKGYLRTFFGKMGFSDVRIRPGHFPYTEPSAEVDVWDSRRKQWVELGGAGIFRPEVTKTLLGTEVPVLAWGLGMERIIKEYYGLEDIRDLYRNDLQQLKSMKVWLR